MSHIYDMHVVMMEVGFITIDHWGPETLVRKCQKVIDHKNTYKCPYTALQWSDIGKPDINSN